MVDVCIDACEAVMRSGTPEMQTAARLLLMTLGREITRRDETAEPRQGDRFAS